VRVGWLVLGLVGCTLPGVDSEGLHVRVAADPGLELCGGTLTHMDAFVARVAEEFGVAAPTGDDRIEYFWLAKEDYAKRSGCPMNSSGCARSGKKVYSFTAPLDHEYVHALAARWGRMPPFFEEGLATAFEGLGTGISFEQEYPPSHGPSRGALEEAMLATSPDSVNYAAAGSFIHYLVQTHGTGTTLRTITGLARDAGSGDIDAAFRAGFGVSVSDSITGFEAFIKKCPLDRTAMLLECDAPTIAWDGHEFAEFREIGCEQEDVVGPFYGDRLMTMRTLEVREGGVFAIQVIGGTAAILFAECGGCGPRQTVRRIDGMAAIELSVGLYSLRVVAEIDATEVGWTIRRAG